MEWLILLVLIFSNALFVLSEIALVSVRKSRLESLAEKGNARAQKALALVQQPEKFLSAAQIGITLIAILTGVYSGEAFAHDLQPWLEKWNWIAPYAETISTTLVVVGVTFLSIVLGELFPKQIGLMRAGDPEGAGTRSEGAEARGGYRAEIADLVVAGVYPRQPG